MRVVLDANVILAALITEGLCHALLEQCMTNHEVCTSDLLRDEVLEKLDKKFYASQKILAQTRAWLKDIAHSYEPEHVPANICRDPDDRHTLGLAAAAHAECIVSGDKDLLVLKKYVGIPILSPREFYTFLQKDYHPDESDAA